MKNLPEPQDIKIAEIREFINRARSDAGFKGLVDSIDRDDLQIPIEVRDIRDEPEETRKRPGGGLYQYERIKGEGRIAAHKALKRDTIRAYVIKSKQADILGRFLTENVNRKPLPWMQKAKLVKADLDAGMTVPQVAEIYSLSENHVRKLERLLTRSAPGIEETLGTMPIAEADALTTMPKGAQQIVVDVLHAEPERLAKDVIRAAQRISDEGTPLTTLGLKESMKRVEDELKALRKSMQVTRLHYAIGPMKLLDLLENRKFAAALKSAGVNTATFLKLAE